MAWLSQLTQLGQQEQAQNQSIQQQLGSNVAFTPEQRQAIINSLEQMNTGWFKSTRSQMYPTMDDATLWSTYQTTLNENRNDSGNPFRDFLMPIAAGGLVGGGIAATLGGGTGAAAGGTGVGAGTGTAEGAFTGGLTGTAAGAPGLTGTASGAPGLSAGAAGASGAAGALSPGFFAAESLYPVAGGLTAAAGGTGAAGAAGTAGGLAPAAAGTALSRVIDGTASNADWLSVLGTGAATGLGIYGANQQSNALQNLANQYMAFGAPSRQRYEASFAPDFKVTDIPGYQSTLDTSWQSALRGLSTSGNPYDNPGGLTEAQKYITGSVGMPILQNYRNQLASTGGYGAFSTAAPAAATGAIGAQGNIYNAIGAGIADVTQPRRQYSLSDIFRGLS